ncbi:unnamed protein product [Camellia sinensis]
MVAVGRQPSPYQLTQSQQCRLQRASSSQPSQRIEYEGGITELWNENEDQFQCAGVAPMRNTLRPNALSLPNYHPAPRLIYIEQDERRWNTTGEGLLGVTFPGCAETFQSEKSQEGRGEEEQEEGGSSRRDYHQKIRRIRRGDIIALPPGVNHWCYNDGNEDLIAVSINDLNHQSNQLDQKLRAYYLAGGAPRRGQQGLRSQEARETFNSVMDGFNPQLLAEAMNVPEELVRRMQNQNERRLIVIAQEGMSMIRPDEREEQGEYGFRSNGFEETFCTMRLHQNIDERREADIYSKQAGRINIVNQHKLPILRFLDMSAERGNLYPNALYTPHWTINSHSIVHVTRGQAQVQIVDNRGQNVMNDRVNEGEMFVIPQYFAATMRAGTNGLEFLSFRTNGSPLKSAVGGYTSVLRAMPLEVITNAYKMSPSQAEGLKFNTGRQTYLASGSS